MRVLIADPTDPAAQEILSQAGIQVDVKTDLSADELKGIIGDYDGMILRSATKVTPELAAAAKKLKVVARAGTGVDNVDIPACTENNIVVMNTPGQNSNAAAELTIGLMLALSRNIPQGTSSLKACQWEKKALKGREVGGKTLGVIGIGAIGGIVAQLAQGLRMKTIAFDPYATPEMAAQIGAEYLDDLEALLSQSDYVTLHIPKTDQTALLINKERIAGMKDGAFLICAARGGIVDEEALCDALNSGKLAGAALDVFATEPPGACALMECNNFICTPHLGASTEEAQINVAVAAAEQIRDLLLKNEIRNALNQV
jgi:D-3-phosphoglycerate dehydrogenase / 2-oxoglutarate reductase